MTRYLKLLSAALGCAFLLSMPLLAEGSKPIDDATNKTKAIKGPVFTDYGPVFKIEDSDIALAKNGKYKVVFDIGGAATETFGLNRKFESVARYMNMHALNGVPLENMDIAVVIHGAATRDGLTQKAYQELYLDNNPTLDLIQKLHAKGVRFYQCGQSLYFKDGQKSDLTPEVKLALSAMTMLVKLQSEGFQIIPWG